MIDLFKVKVSDEKLHHNFKELLKENDNFVRELLLEWTDGFIDRDNKLAIEFQTTFNSTFWELYLFNVFKKWQINIDFSFNRPDFVCNKFEEFIVEAAIASNALTDKPEWEAEYENEIKDDFLRNLVKTATIRLANAIASKHKKYISEYSKLDHVKKKPFIIAVAPFEQPFFWEQSQSAITQVLYGIQGIRYINDEVHNTREILGIDYIDYIEKDNGTQIDLGFFTNNYMSEISAVIFNNCATFGKLRALTKERDERDMLFMFVRFNKFGLHPIQKMVNKNEYEESIEDGMNIYLNPYARYPVPRKFVNLFPSICNYDVFDRIITGDAKDGMLYKRMVTVLNTY